MPTAIVNGVGLYHEAHGSGFPLVLLMGFGDDCGAWSQQLPAFSARYRTIVYDHRGVGRSDKPQTGYSIRQFADDTVGLLDHLDVARAHLLGYSMGGRVAQDLAARHPGRVASIVLASSAAKPNALNLYCLKASAYLYRTFGPEAASAFGPVISFTHAHFTEHLSELTEALGKPPADPMPDHAFEGHVRAIEGHDTTPILGDIKAPTLVLMGDQEWLNPRSDADVLLQGIPGSRLRVLEGGGHGFIWEIPNAFNHAVLEFLDAHTPRRAIRRDSRRLNTGSRHRR